MKQVIINYLLKSLIVGIKNKDSRIIKIGRT